MAGNSKMNGIALGAAFGGLGLLAIKGVQGAVGQENLANTIYGWFISGGTAIQNAIPQITGISHMVYAFAIAILAGALVGAYTEYK
jgi:hypothetical protein